LIFMDVGMINRITYGFRHAARPAVAPYLTLRACRPSETADQPAHQPLSRKLRWLNRGQNANRPAMPI